MPGQNLTTLHSCRALPRVLEGKVSMQPSAHIYFDNNMLSIDPLLIPKMGGRDGRCRGSPTSASRSHGLSESENGPKQHPVLLQDLVPRAMMSLHGLNLQCKWKNYSGFITIWYSFAFINDICRTDVVDRVRRLNDDPREEERKQVEIPERNN